VSRRIAACTPNGVPLIGYTLMPFALTAPDEFGAMPASAPNETALIITTTMSAAHVDPIPCPRETRRGSLFKDKLLRRDGGQ
jgi:hypothetical protein